jgi:hypothetical protein
MKKLRPIILTVFLICAMPLLVFAGSFDGSVTILCAVVETFGCNDIDKCQEGMAQDIDIPQFLSIDFKNKMISGKQGKNIRTTKIENMEKNNERLILQGTQEGKGWSMVIIESTGKMTLTASDDDVGFVVFGACTTK